MPAALIKKMYVSDQAKTSDVVRFNYFVPEVSPKTLCLLQLFIVKHEYYIHCLQTLLILTNTNRTQCGYLTFRIIALELEHFVSSVHLNVFFHLSKCLLTIVVNALYKHWDYFLTSGRSKCGHLCNNNNQNNHCCSVQWTSTSIDVHLLYHCTVHVHCLVDKINVLQRCEAPKYPGLQTVKTKGSEWR